MIIHQFDADSANVFIASKVARSASPRRAVAAAALTACPSPLAVASTSAAAKLDVFASNLDATAAHAASSSASDIAIGVATSPDWLSLIHI